MSLIFYLSSLSYPPQPLPQTVKEAPIIEHFIEFAILGSLLFIGFRSIKIYKYALLFAILVGIFYAITDEIHQFFVPGRYASIFDVIVDSLGIIFAVILMKIYEKKIFNI